MSEFTLADAKAQIEALNDNVIAQLNRIGALEALARELLHHTPTEVLADMVQTYDAQTVLAMQQLQPPFQREHLWTHFRDTMEDIVATRRGERGKERPAN